MGDAIVLDERWSGRRRPAHRRRLLRAGRRVTASVAGYRRRVPPARSRGGIRNG